MPARVTLAVTKGPREGHEHTFEERTVCMVGRAYDCVVLMPDDADHERVSRHHCLLDINPPDVRIRDCGSLNGAFVNGENIGQREKGQTPEEGAKLQLPERELRHGDEIRLGNTTFTVRILVPEVCSECSEEIAGRAHPPRPDTAVAIRATCDACRKKAEEERKRAQEAQQAAAQAGQAAPPKPAPPKPKPVVCAKCGKDVAAEIGPNRRGELVCAACRADPEAILRALLGLANRGDKNLVAIQGYAIQRELGIGGMGAVYLARHEKSGDQVALKVMQPQVAMSSRAKDGFLRETENTRALRHEYVVRLRDAGCSHGTFFFTVEFCDGGSVDKLMEQRGGVLPVDEAIEIILQALDGLEYAHHAEIPKVKLENGSYGRGHGLVHRDIKPHNLFLSGSGGSRTAKVGDFGLAKAFDTAGLSGHTSPNTVAGTVPFMPRQQVINYCFAQSEVDVWAMAASLYFMLTGQPPREFPRGQDPYKVVLETDAVPIQNRKPAIPRKLADVIDEALVDQPEIRIKSAAELKRALEGAIR